MRKATPRPVIRKNSGWWLVEYHPVSHSFLCGTGCFLAFFEKHRDAVVAGNMLARHLKRRSPPEHGTRVPCSL